jgi:transposase
MARQRRKHTREFKVQAVKLVTEKGLSVAEACRSLDICETLLRSWKAAFEAQGAQAFPGNGRLPAVEEELRRLRAENKRLLMERDILKERRPSSPRRRRDGGIPLRRPPPGPLARPRHVPGAGGLGGGLLRLARARSRPAAAPARGPGRGDPRGPRRGQGALRQPARPRRAGRAARRAA